MKKGKFIIILMIAIVIFIIIFTIMHQKFFTKKDNEFENKADKIENTDISNSSDNINEIEELKKQLNSTADTNIYQIDEEQDGRKILQVKNEVQFNVDLAGIIKNGKPEENEIEDLVKKKPKKSGIWISKQSREKFLQLLKNNNIESFEIDNDGFLKLKTKNTEIAIEKEIQDMIESNNHYIINMTGVSYERDYISGEIIEYPFEDMDPAQIIEPYILNDYIILEITSNKNKEIPNKDIIESIVEYK